MSEPEWSVSESTRVNPGGEGDLEIRVVPALGDVDASAFEAAAVALHNVDGTLPPLILVRTWSIEAEQIRGLARELGPDQPVYSIAPPDFADPEAYPFTVEAWCDFMDERLDLIGFDGPVLIGGWSFGGVIALELAERIVSRGGEILRLFLFDSRVPKEHKQFEGKRAKFPTRTHRLARHMLEYCALPTRKLRNEYLRYRLSPVRRLRKIRTGIVKRLASRNESTPVTAQSREAPRAVETSKGEMMTPLMRAIHRAYLKYDKHLTNLPVAQFWTDISCRKAGNDSSLGWSSYFRGEVIGIRVEGEHMTMFDDVYLPALAREVEKVLRRAVEDAPGYRAEITSLGS